MLHVVTGGSGSGKSEYAEKLITESVSRSRIYVATMMVWDEEGRERVRRHREMRAGKGFITMECYTGLSSLELSDGGGQENSLPKAGEDTSVLLECMSNLASNEFYRDEENALNNILEGVEHLRRQCRELVIVTNEVFGDGTDYGEETMRYIRLLGEINCRLGQMADTVTEVVYGIPLRVKGQGREMRQ